MVEALRGIGSDRFRILLTVVPPRPSRDGEEAHYAGGKRGTGPDREYPPPCRLPEGGAGRRPDQPGGALLPSGRRLEDYCLGAGEEVVSYAQNIDKR